MVVVGCVLRRVALRLGSSVCGGLDGAGCLGGMVVGAGAVGVWGLEGVVSFRSGCGRGMMRAGSDGVHVCGLSGGCVGGGKFGKWRFGRIGSPCIVSGWFGFG